MESALVIQLVRSAIAESNANVDGLFHFLPEDVEIDVNVVDPQSQKSLLFLAAEASCAPVLLHLLRRGADVNHGCAGQFAPLHAAAEAGSLRIAEILLSHGADCMNRSSISPLHIAATGGHIDVCRLLLEHGASVNSITNDGGSVLYLAALGNQSRAIHFLLSHGARTRKESIDFDEYKCGTPLAVAVMHGHFDAVQALLSRGACVNHVDRYGNYPLGCAAYFGRDKMLSILIEAGASSNATPRTHRHHRRRFLPATTTSQSQRRSGVWSSPLHLASTAPIVHLLALCGADVDYEIAASGWTALHSACSAAHVEKIRALLAIGANPLSLTLKRRSPINLLEQSRTDAPLGDVVTARSLLLHFSSIFREAQRYYRRAITIYLSLRSWHPQNTRCCLPMIVLQELLRILSDTQFLYERDCINLLRAAFLKLEYRQQR